MTAFYAVGVISLALLPFSGVSAVRYHVVDLMPDAAVRSEAQGITTQGDVWGTLGGGYFVWRDGQTEVIDPPPGAAGFAVSGLGSAPASVAYYPYGNMTDAGQFAGSIFYVSRPSVPFVGWPTGPRLLPTNFSPTSVNIALVTSGYSYVPVEYPPGSRSTSRVQRAAIAMGKQVLQLGSLGGLTNLSRSFANAINDGGTVVGWSMLATGGAVHAFSWQGGVMTDLHGTPGRANSIPLALNQTGATVGYIFDSEPFRLPFAWNASDGMQVLPIPGYSTGTALGLNNRGEIVGAGGNNAVYWSNGVMTILQTVTPPGWGIDAAYAINDAGEIVGYGRPPGGGLTRALLLRPTNTVSSPITVRFGLFDPVLSENPDMLTGFTVTGNETLLNTLSKASSGTVADGTAMLVIRATTTNSGSLTFSLQAMDGAQGVTGNAFEDGTLGVPGIVRNDPIATYAVAGGAGQKRIYILYNAPHLYHRAGQNDSANAQRIIGLRATFATQSATQDYTIPIVIARPPVVVMHGIWSTRQDAFGGFEQEMLAREPGIQFFGRSYPNWVSFRENEHVLPDELDGARKTTRLGRVACSRADVFGHSMGGVLSRIWAGNTNYKSAVNFQRGDIHRLVTIDSPHHGAFVADEGAKFLSKLDFPCRVLVEILAAKYNSRIGGATYDLASTSREIVQMNQRPTFVSSHVIAGDLDTYDHLLRIPLLFFLNVVAQGVPCVSGTLNWPDLPPRSDLVVELESQLADMAAPDHKSIFQHEHSGAANQLPAIERCQFLLRQSDYSSPYFNVGFPTGWVPPPPASSTLEAANVSSAAGEPSITHWPGLITSPAAGSVFYTGQTLDVRLSPPAGVTLTSAMAVTRGQVVQTNTPPHTLRLTIPIESAGNLEIAALATDSANNTWYDVISVRIFSAASLVGLSADATELHFTRAGSQRQLTIVGTFTDGVVRDMTEAGIGYSSTDTNVVSVTTNGLLTADANGTAIIRAQYGSANAWVSATVSLTPLCDLVLSQRLLSARPSSGNAVTLSLEVTNAGAEAAYAVALADILPNGAQFLSATPSQGGCVQNKGELNCEFGRLPAGAGTTVLLRLIFPTGGLFRNSADVNSRYADVNPADNGRDLEINVLQLPRLSIRRDAAEVVISWPVVDAGYTLETTASLAQSISWSPVSKQFVTNGAMREVRIPIAPGQEFLRLQNP